MRATQFPPVGGADAGFSYISAVETGPARPLYGWFQPSCPPAYNFPAHQRGDSVDAGRYANPERYRAGRSFGR